MVDLISRIARIWNAPVALMMILFALGSLVLDRREMTRKGLKKEERLTLLLGIVLSIIAVLGYILLQTLSYVISLGGFLRYC